MAIERIITAIPKAIPARAILTMGFENEFSPLSLPLSILRAMKDSKFNAVGMGFRTRKSRKLIVRQLLLVTLLFGIGSLAARCNTSEKKSVNPKGNVEVDKPVQTGAAQIDSVVAYCTGKRVGIVANQTSLVAGVHLVDTLRGVGVEVVRIFGPEHGFRGDAADGQMVESGTDSATGLPVVSLYGKNRKPTAEQLAGIDLLVFDIQDVGARFYTYISTLHLVMEAAAENGIPVLVLDRPNPNGHFVDGPVLDPAFSSFVGMHPVPVVHGMTIGEYAQMINGERWLKGGLQCDLQVLSCTGYNHKQRYDLPVAPSPNLPNMRSVYLYPSLAFFEGTEVSVGRGTPYPFQQIGMPNFASGNHQFTPISIPGVSTYPPQEGKVCVGFDLREQEYSQLNRIDLSWLLNMYAGAPDKKQFFLKSGFFDKLAGTNQLRQQVEAGLSEQEIIESWQPALNKFLKVRTKYLIYEDF